jgi:putative DNA primase/helicase
VVDYFLKDKLREEVAGILRWAINGAVAWYQEGITIPDTWAKATRQFLEEQSRIADKRDPKEAFPRWIAECCLTGEAQLGPAGKLQASWRDWCKTNGVDLRRFDFKPEMEKAGFYQEKKKQGLIYSGIRLT